MKRLALRTYLLLSLVAAAFLGVIVYYGTRNTTETLVAAGITFIVTVVVIATLELSAKDNPAAADEPHLH